MPEFETTVTIDDVRAALAEVDPSFIPDSTISQKIDLGEYDVNHKIGNSDAVDYDTTDQTAFDMAVRAVAARRAWNSTPTEVRRQALDTARSYDIQEMRAQLRRNEEEAWERLGLPAEGGTSAAFVDATRHVGDMGDRHGSK